MAAFASATPALGPTINQFFDAMPSGAYYEFGLYQGYTLWAVQQRAVAIGRDMRFYGFDSFEGIPPNDSGQWREGEFACSYAQVFRNLAEHGADMSRIELFKGWFGCEWFRHLLDIYTFEPAAVVVIDSDLYESCVPVLWFVGRFFQPGTLVFFDDWKAYDNNPNDGEQLAWREYQESHPSLLVESVGDFSQYGHIEIVRSTS